MEKILLAYVPVLHQGYRAFFEEHSDAVALYILGPEIISGFAPLRKDIRALAPRQVKQAIESWGIFKTVRIADEMVLSQISAMKYHIVMPREEECEEIASRYFPNCSVNFCSVFLRWDSASVKVESEVRYDKRVKYDGLVAAMMSRAEAESGKASNWWRRVGAVLARDGEILLAGYNRHVPSPHLPYVEGEPRMFFKRGLHIELTTDHHAEARLIAAAARNGIALEGADIYITTFPCPPCAKSVAYAGIRRCFYRSGYAVLDGERILRDNGVEIIYVEQTSCAN